MRQAACPSCGAAVRFRGATSIVAVCEFCRSTLVRDGVKLEDIGKQAELLADASPIQLGVEGRHNGVHFAVVGRIQYRYGAGVWNEWYLLFDSGRNGWLSDANGRYLVSYLAAPEQVPAFESLQPDQTLVLGGEKWRVTDLQRAEVVAGEGELPFKVGAGWPAPVADLRGARNRYATIDYSDAPPMLYFGELLPFDTFGFAGLRDAEAIGQHTAKARAFRCPSCAAALERRIATTEAVGCGNCGAVIDVTTDEAKVISAARTAEKRARPAIPLGSRARWRGVDYEVVGHLRRKMTVEGQDWFWDEYLLHNLEQGYLWIVQSQGHFSVVKDAAEIPVLVPGMGPPQLRYLGRSFRHFQAYEAEVVSVLGEFHWRVRVGDTVKVNDYVAPPLILSAERGRNESSWSLGEYVEGEDLWAAFKLKSKPPAKVGVAPNQPSPHEGRTGRYVLAWIGIAVVALLLQFVFDFTGPAKLLKHEAFSVQPGVPLRQMSRVFEVPGPRVGPNALHVTTDLKNAGMTLEATLVNVQTKRAWRVALQPLEREVPGVEKVWSGHFARLEALPPGRYTLGVAASIGERARPVKGAIELRRGAVGWWNFLLLLGALAVPVFLVWMRSRSFETARWAESDYAPQAADDDEDE